MNILGVTSAVVISMTPVLEVRGAIPIAVALGMSIWSAFLICVLANIILIPLVFFFLDYVHGGLMNIGIYNRVFSLYLSRVRRKAESKVSGVWPYFALFLFVGLPLPGTGVWTGVLVSWFFRMNRKRSFVSLALGSVFVSLIVVLVTLGIVGLW